ncbi:MAG TPA: glycosyl hydrolase family 57, partial [Anaerolineae bacterium]|nr:glycosyl hydrolase family 57 [Anaerolineae bacterium]
MTELQEYINGIPNISGNEAMIEEAMRQGRNKTIFLNESGIDFGRIRSCFAIALHMQQPLIPAGGDNLQTAAIIS